MNLDSKSEIRSYIADGVDLEICGGNKGCAGCSREDPYGGGIGCDKLELDAAELIKKLQKKVKELEEKK